MTSRTTPSNSRQLSQSYTFDAATGASVNWPVAIPVDGEVVGLTMVAQATSVGRAYLYDNTGGLQASFNTAMAAGDVTKSTEPSPGVACQRNTAWTLVIEMSAPALTTHQMTLRLDFLSAQ